MSGTQVFLVTVDVVSICLFIGVIIYWRYRNRRHKIALMMIRVGRLTPVEFMKGKKRRQKWKALGVEPRLGYIVGSEMSFEEEMDLLRGEVKKIEDSL